MPPRAERDGLDARQVKPMEKPTTLPTKTDQFAASELNEDDLKLKTELESCLNDVDNVLNSPESASPPVATAKKTRTRSSARLRKDSSPSPKDDCENISSMISTKLDRMSQLIREATTSMTSVPKPLKFLMPHYAKMQTMYDAVDQRLCDTECAKLFADIMSVVAMTADNPVDDEVAKKKDDEKDASETQDKQAEDAASKIDAEKKADDAEEGDQPESLECLRYKLCGHYGDPDSVGRWGHEYVRHLSAQVVVSWNRTNEAVDAYLDEDAPETTAKMTESDAEQYKAKVLVLVKSMVNCLMSQHAECEACDLLSEIDHLDTFIHEAVDKENFQRVCLYLTACVPYVASPENTNVLRTALKIYTSFKAYPLAMRIALQLNDSATIRSLFSEVKDGAVKKQLALMLGRHHYHLDSEEDGLGDDLVELLSNGLLNQSFLNVARELDIVDAKTPDDVYKSHFDQVRPFSSLSGVVDSAVQGFASSFVNAFVNAGFGSDKLILVDDGNKWLYKNKKDSAMMSATASMGLILLWDVDGGLTRIDRYLYAPETEVRAGALLACGLVNAGVRNECDPALALLSDYVCELGSGNTDANADQQNKHLLQIGAILGLALAYAGSDREDVIGELIKVFATAYEGPTVVKKKTDMMIWSMAALALGLVSVGSANNDVVTTMLSLLIKLGTEAEAQSDSASSASTGKSSGNKAEEAKSPLNDSPYAKFIALGLGLCYLGRQDAVEATLAALEVLPDPFKSFAITTVDVCGYAGTGNVLKIQELLHICSRHFGSKSDGDNDDGEDSSSRKTNESGEDSSGDKSDANKDANVDLSTQQSMATLGLAVIALGDDIGKQMLFRMFGHLLRYCEPSIRRVVPLALALTSISDPAVQMVETLGKFSHDSDGDVALSAIIGLGLVGAGTNNARLAAMLRQLAQYYGKDSTLLYTVRLAQGFVHMGKGTLTLNPFHSDNFLMSRVAVGGLLSVLLAFAIEPRGQVVPGLRSGYSSGSGSSSGSGNSPTVAYLVYLVATAISARVLLTLDEATLRPLPVLVRVGQAVDVVGHAGKPKTITGFQTHMTPVLLASGERAELANADEYMPLSPVMEGFVLLRKLAPPDSGDRMDVT